MRELSVVYRVGVTPNRRLKSATRSHPVIGGTGDIPVPTVKVRMRVASR